MKMITLKCDYCQSEFEKPLKEYKRNQKRGMIKNFCNLSCFAFDRNGSMTDDYWSKRYEKQKKTFDIKSQSGNRQNEYSSFKVFLNPSRASMKKHKNEIDIDVEYLKQQWEKQNGLCPYTGLAMILPKNSADRTKSMKKASLDRIDSSKGYVKGNVEFVCMAINLAKRNYTKEEMVSFLKDTLSVNQTQPT
jgi:hypothetical protein